MNDINRDWFKIWEKNRYPEVIPKIGTILSLYSPYFLDEDDEVNGPYTAGVTLGVFKHRNQKKNKFNRLISEGNELNNLILLSVFPRVRLDANEVVVHAKNLCIDYLNNDYEKTYEGSSPDVMIVPSCKGIRSGIFSEIQYKNDVDMRFFYHADHGKTLENLLKRALPRIIQGKIWVVAKPDSRTQELRNMDEKFLDILSSYPSMESRGMVWALVQAIVYLDRNGIFEEESEQVVIKPKHGFYGILEED